jgi:hypothetical protein
MLPERKVKLKTYAKQVAITVPVMTPLRGMVALIPFVSRML